MAIRNIRIVLVLFGLALMGLGGYIGWIWLSHKQYAHVIEWLVGALIVHDGIIAPAVFVVTLVGRRLGTRIPAVVIALVEGALAIGGIFTLLFLPEVLKKLIGTASDSILPQNYALHLGVFYVVLALLTAAAVGFYFRVFVRRQNLRPPAVQA
jgi:cytochrome bd-type quinol oxidase subunit 2